jgi:hypothetical protein
VLLARFPCFVHLSQKKWNLSCNKGTVLAAHWALYYHEYCCCCYDYTPLLGLGHFSSFSVPYMGISLLPFQPMHRTTESWNKHTDPMPGVGLEPTTLVFEQAEIVPVLNLCGHCDMCMLIRLKIQVEALFSIDKERI